MIVLGGSADEYAIERAVTEIDLLLRVARNAQTLASSGEEKLP